MGCCSSRAWGRVCALVCTQPCGTRYTRALNSEAWEEERLFQFYFEIVFLRQNRLKWQLFIWKSDCRLESPCVTLCRGMTLVGSRGSSTACCMGFGHIPCFYCVWFWVWFLSGMLWALLFACSPYSPSKEGAGQFPGDPPSGYPGKSPLRKVLSPAHITPSPREADGGCGSLPFSLFP